MVQAAGKALVRCQGRKAFGRPSWKGLCILVGAVCALSLGCESRVPHQPNPRFAAELGLPQAQQRLREVLLRSVNPPINAVEITDDFIRVDLANTTYQVRMFFKDVQRAEIFNNHLVVIRGANDAVLFRPVFANAQDAQSFADLMLSWRQR